MVTCPGLRPQAALAVSEGVSMQVPSLVWILTVAGIVALLAFDFFFHVRKATRPA